MFYHRTEAVSSYTEGEIINLDSNDTNDGN